MYLNYNVKTVIKRHKG